MFTQQYLATKSLHDNKKYVSGINSKSQMANTGKHPQSSNMDIPCPKKKSSSQKTQSADNIIDLFDEIQMITGHGIN